MTAAEERQAVVRYLQHLGEHELARRIEQGRHLELPPPQAVAWLLGASAEEVSRLLRRRLGGR